MAAMSLGSLPLGYRFRPTDAELVDHYLRLKINGDDKNSWVIGEIDVRMHEPWDLPDLSAIPTKDPEWFFFCPRNIRHSRGNRLNRATRAGTWKATGKDRQIKLNGKLIGMKKTLVFYIGRAPKGKRTHWVMHEYRTTLEELDGTHPGQSAFVLCRLFNKQDETIENSNLDDSPTSVESSPDDVESEREMPQDSPSPSLPSGPYVDHEAKHRASELQANEVNLQPENDSTFDYPLMNPLFSPLPLEIKGHDQLICGRLNEARFIDDNDVTTFLDSVLIDGNSIGGAAGEHSHPMDFGLANEGSLAMLDNPAVDLWCPEVKLDENVLRSCLSEEHDKKDRKFSSIAGQINDEAPSCPCHPESESPIMETAIRIRRRPQVEVTTSPKVAAQGDASRRLRVQRRLQIGPTICRVYPRGPEQSNENLESKTLQTEEPKAIKLEEQSEVVSSVDARAKDDIPRTVNGGGWSSSAYTFLTQRKGLLLPCSSIYQLRFFTLLVLSLGVIGTLFCSSSSSYN